MSPATLQFPRIRLVPKTRADVEAMIEAMSPDDRAQISEEWLAQFRASTTVDPWVYGFSAVLRETGEVIGTGGFAAPPAEGAVEIAYGVNESRRGQGFASEIAAALTQYCLANDQVRMVFAHTMPDGIASQRALLRCGFEHAGEVMHPTDGRVFRFELRRDRAAK